MNLGKRASTYRTTKKSILSAAQKGVKSRSAKAIKLKNEVMSTNVQGVGMYKDKTLTPRQKYKLEKRALKNERLKIQSKPEAIKAVGSAIMRGSAVPGATFGTTAGISTGTTAGNKIGSLIQGGANKSGVANEEELQDAENVMPDGYIVR